MAIAKFSQSIIKKIFFLSIRNSLLILLVIGYFSDRFWQNRASFFTPQPTQLQAKDSALLLKQIQSMQELTTTIYQTETIVPTSADLTVGKNWKIATTKLLYLAKGEIRAGIDLSELTREDIQVSPNQIAIALPPAKILDSKIDLHSSQVYHYDRGFLNLGPDVAPQLQTLAQQKTLAKIATNACNEGILKTANAKAKEAILQLLTLTHTQKIKIKIDTSITQNCNF
jgi:hypothetical protein